MDRIFKVYCADSYEAEKLASMLSGNRDDKPGVRAVAAVHGEEIVLRLTDQSSHSVMLKDAGSARDFREILLGLLASGANVKGAEQKGDVVELKLPD